MQTRSVLDVRTVVVVASVVALVTLTMWSIGLWLSSTQSLQNQVNDLIAQKNTLLSQVTSLQNEVTSLNDQLAARQEKIQNLESLVTYYRKDIANLLEQLHPEPRGGYGRARI